MPAPRRHVQEGQPGIVGKGCIIFFPLIFVATGVGGIFYTWRRKRKRADGSEASESISSKAKKWAPWAIVIFFGLFLAMGLGFFCGMFLPAMIKIEQAKDWPETPCAVTGDSRVRSHAGDDSTTYSIEVPYSYTYNGRKYKSNRYSFVIGSSSAYEGKKAIVDAHPKGMKTLCYVNPDDPYEAVLERGYTSDMWFALIPLVFVAVGAGGIFFAVRHHLRKKARIGRPHAAVLDHARPGIVDRDVPSGPVTLKPKQSPLGKLIGITGFALVWNGLVSFFVWQVIKGWQTGQGEWFLTLFMVPFVLVGLGSIGAIVYFALALLNPRPRFTVSSDAVPLGGTAGLRWEFTGQVNRISKFEIVLEGREQATYRRGTNTVTDKKVFATLPIVEIDDWRDMAAGEATVAIPPDTMHSFEADNNRIIWTLKVHGDIRLWPDVKEEFPLTVLPTATEEE